MTKGIYRRRIAMNDAPHPAPHGSHAVRHRFVAKRYMGQPDGPAWCCDKPITHPIHKNRYKR